MSYKNKYSTTASALQQTLLCLHLPQEIQWSHRQQAAYHSQGHRSPAGDQVHHRGGHVRYEPTLWIFPTFKNLIFLNHSYSIVHHS